MLKGTNHRIIEVIDGDNEYFDRVIFFVRPEYSAVSEGTLRDRADAVARGMSAPPPSRITAHKWLTAGVLCAAAGIGAGIATVISVLF
ncbi:MAG: hypothetical protein LBR73_09640 [Oscillospiraceae bacterium]|jgi:hypothetical protein|nr:hypothetical protein [Oscillospiraceae bacterium]